jgi:hypothetical protein
MVYKKNVSKKIISLAMNDLEEAILETKQKSTIKKRKESPVKIFPYKDKKSDDILLLTDIVEESNFYKENNAKLIFKQSIESLVESDIRIWIKNNLQIESDKYVKEAINSINYDKK